ncbi:MAG: hypothetical protein ACQESB_02800 [Elusimicrobiota bacterium]
MKKNNRKVKAVALLSGGLDSTLAVHMIKEQGVELLCVHFSSPFCTCSSGCGEKNYAAMSAEKLDLSFMNVPMGQDYLDMVASPKYGYGKNMNPCIDCRIHKFKSAKKIMEEKEADFIVTGELLGQRPMSQNLRSMKLIESEAMLKGLVLRPLSAGVLEPSIPEKKNWVDRNKLLSLSGRSRKEHSGLADKYGISEDEYACPAGGCRLTNIEYSNKVRDIIENKGRLKMDDIVLLSYGRHFRIDSSFKLVVGRDQKENEALDKINRGRYPVLFDSEYKGPLCLGIGELNEERLNVSARICAFYSKCPDNKGSVFKWQLAGESGSIDAAPMSLSEIEKFRI